MMDSNQDTKQGFSYESALDRLIDSLAAGNSGSSVLSALARELQTERDGEPEATTSDAPANV